MARDARNNDDMNWINSSKYELINLPARALAKSHAIFGPLFEHPDAIDYYRVYKNMNYKYNASDVTIDGNDYDEDIVKAVISFGHSLNGHPGIVHGGILALMFDDIFGFAFEALGVPFAFTANIKVDYRKPIPAGSAVHVHVQLVRRENRKLFFKAQITSPEKIIYTEATTLYIIPKQ